MRTRLRELVSPVATVTARFGSPRCSARNSHNAAFARPSTGGALILTFSAGPSHPAIALRGALGETFTSRRQCDVLTAGRARSPQRFREGGDDVVR